MVPDEVYRRLLREVFGLTEEELGLVEQSFSRVGVEGPTDELAARLAQSTTVDAALVTLVRQQTDTVRLLDRRLGAPALLEQMRAHIATLQGLVTHAVLDSTRRPIAAVLADAATLAGWQALDVGATAQAWGHFEVAKAAAREAGDAALLTHAKEEQAYALLDVQRPADGVALLQEARDEGARALPARMVSWLWAAEAELLAAADDEMAFRRALDTAARLLPSHNHDPELPYLSLDDCHLARWRGHSLARLGDREAIDHLSGALAQHDAQFTRARGSLLIDLAKALTVSGERGQAQVHIDAARQLVAQTGSVRQRRRLRELAT
ncbi:hypothetical protein [Kineococcus auxinigenes]|uniref:hypothetical protein n=1 Tax=unclassified Kineococcus TaxID=2621656 RepID=UPI003D7D7797